MTSPYRDDTGAAIDLIDAALYSGDEFLDPQRRAALRATLHRWQVRLYSLEEVGDDYDEQMGSEEK